MKVDARFTIGDVVESNGSVGVIEAVVVHYWVESDGGVTNRLLSETDLKLVKAVELCEHRDDDTPPNYYGISSPEREMDWNYTYCPICGDKL